MADQKNQAADLIKWMEDIFKKVPNLPENGREVLVKIAPILSLVFGILGIIVGIGAMGISPLALLGGVDSSILVLLTGVVSIVSSVLMLMAYPKLNKRLYRGWELLFWSEAIGVVSAVLTLSIGSVLGVLIGFYLLFQIKSYYK